jgi:hypothetical protein
MEPSITLNDFRYVRGIGLLVGSYYGADIVQNRETYERLCKPEDGYIDFDTSVSCNPIETRDMDGWPYIRIYKTDVIKLRANKDMEWIR